MALYLTSTYERMHMLERIKAVLEPIAKAVVALVVPIVVPILVDWVAEAETIVIGLITAAATAITVWAVPNKAA